MGSQRIEHNLSDFAHTHTNILLSVALITFFGYNQIFYLDLWHHDQPSPSPEGDDVTLGVPNAFSFGSSFIAHANSPWFTGQSCYPYCTGEKTAIQEVLWPA